MDKIAKNLEKREKNELIALVKHMVLQEPNLQWLLTTSLPTPSSEKTSADPKIYQQQVLAAMAAGDYPRKPARHEVERRLTAIKAIADDFVKYEQYATALTIYEVLVNEIIAHYNDYRDEYIAFSVVLTACIDGLDACFAGETDNQKIRLRVLQALFAIFRFYTDSSMDLDEDIPGLLVGNTTAEEHHIIAGWARDALAEARNKKWITGYEMGKYHSLLQALNKQ